jgi:hypothetical protein
MVYSCVLAMGLLRPDVVVEQGIFAGLSALEINEPMTEIAKFGKAYVAWCFIRKGMTDEEWFPLTTGLNRTGVWCSWSSFRSFEYLRAYDDLTVRIGLVRPTVGEVVLRFSR